MTAKRQTMEIIEAHEKERSADGLPSTSRVGRWGQGL